jgi:aspartyl-tRNA(Asn)/glutamyl-tRNA(Gln) amidotransferase subunit A
LRTHSSLSSIRQELFAGTLTCAQLVDQYLTNIRANAHLNALVEVYEEEARKKAAEIDHKIQYGTAGRLAGMFISVKDVLCHKDHRSQAGSRILENFESQFTATAIERLLNEDAIVIGRANCDEFGMGSSNENSFFGPVKNAIDEERVPGGSSGGSAVSVQADMCLIALGTDTGGSVRQPASFCGIVGIKPTYGRVSRYGLIAYASSFDTIGVFGKSVEDVALTLEIMAGSDQFDSTSSKKPVPSYSKNLSFEKKARIAYIKETIESEGLNAEVKTALLTKIDQLKAAGHTVEEVTFPYLSHLLPTYYILTTAEASANLSRFDGVRYGYRSPNASSLESMYKKTRSEGFGEEVKRRILLGTFVLSASYYDAYYIKALKVRRLIKEATEKILADYDFLITPTAPTTAYKLGERSKNPIEMYLGDIYTVQASVCGLPGISIPIGNDQKGLPIGMQVVGKAFDEQELLAFSNTALSLA